MYYNCMGEDELLPTTKLLCEPELVPVFSGTNSQGKTKAQHDTENQKLICLSLPGKSMNGNS